MFALTALLAAVLFVVRWGLGDDAMTGPSHETYARDLVLFGALALATAFGAWRLFRKK
jgi:hypothetical protein